MLRRILLLLPTTLLLTGCGLFPDSLDQSKIPAYTKDWVREQDGETLTFRNKAGQIHRLEVARQEGTYTTRGRYTSSEVAYLEVQYHDLTDSALSFNLSTYTTRIQIQRQKSISGPISGEIATDEKMGKVLFYSYPQSGSKGPVHLVTRDTTLGGRAFKYLGRIRMQPQQHPLDTLTDIYFSRYDGVVGFITKRAGLWVRQ